MSTFEIALFAVAIVFIMATPGILVGICVIAIDQYLREARGRTIISHVIIVLLCILVAILFSYLIWPPGEL